MTSQLPAPSPTPTAAPNGPHTPAEGALSGATAAIRPGASSHRAPTGAGARGDVEPGGWPGAQRGVRPGASW